jgi:hypothetical protein
LGWLRFVLYGGCWARRLYADLPGSFAWRRASGTQVAAEVNQHRIVGGGLGESYGAVDSVFFPDAAKVDLHAFRED